MTPAQLPAAWREWYEERAAIAEYDGGLSRERAEAEAMRLVLAEMRKANNRERAK